MCCVCVAGALIGIANFFLLFFRTLVGLITRNCYIKMFIMVVDP